MLFPEGTRTSDGTLKPFKRGGLLIGVETGIQIVPVAFVGTFEMLDKDSWIMKNHPIELRIGIPIPSENYSNDTRRELAVIVQQNVQALLDQAS